MEHLPQPIADERADDADDEVADDAIAAAPHDLAGEPAGNEADDQYDDQTIGGQHDDDFPLGCGHRRQAEPLPCIATTQDIRGAADVSAVLCQVLRQVLQSAPYFA